MTKQKREIKNMAKRVGDKKKRDDENLTRLYNVELVDLAVPWEQGLSVYELPHDAPDGPQVDGGIVPSGAQEKLGRSIPPGSFFFQGHRAVPALSWEKQAG